jgi:hypothetical protein
MNISGFSARYLCFLSSIWLKMLLLNSNPIHQARKKQDQKDQQDQERGTNHRKNPTIRAIREIRGKKVLFSSTGSTHRTAAHLSNGKEGDGP